MSAVSFNPLGPWRHPLRLWRVGCYVLTAMPLAIVRFALIVTFLALTFGFVPTVFLAIPMAWLTSIASRLFGHIERNRIAALAGVRIPDPVTPSSEPKFWQRLKANVSSAARWRELAHHVAHLPVAVLGFSFTTAAWSGSLALAALPAYLNDLPENEAKFYFFDVHQGVEAGLTAAVGAIGVVLIAPWVTIGVARVELALARALLGPTSDAEYAAQVNRLESQRGAAVDSAEAERRRIERDLHDGAQQRLVALAAGLGAARQKFDSTAEQQFNPEEGRRMVAEAHEEAKAALKEIRDLVRGIHPVILEDRGLDAALSAVIARSPVPVTLDVALTARPPAPVESAAYFVVSEALANVAKHSNATRAKVSIARAGNRLVVEIHDNGQGGASPDRGSGLRGLRDRVDGLGGSMYVISPRGGPTTVSVELPCGS